MGLKASIMDLLQFSRRDQSSRLSTDIESRSLGPLDNVPMSIKLLCVIDVVE